MKRHQNTLAPLKTQPLAAAEWIEQQRANYHSSMDRGAAQCRLRLRSFEIGDLVALQYPNFDKLPQKLREKYSGPYKVVGTPSATSGSYTLQRRAGGARTFLAHVDRLTQFHEVSEAATSAAQAIRSTSRRYDVAHILDHRMTTGGTAYKVLWAPCPDNDMREVESTWKLESDLKCAEKLQMYHKQNAWDIGALSMTEQNDHQATPSEPTSVTLMRSDILDNDPCSLLLHICKAAKIDPKRVLFVWGSPPCTTMSRADASNISRDNHFRDHSNPDRPPKSWDISDPKVPTAVEHNRFLPALMQMATADRLRGQPYTTTSCSKILKPPCVTVRICTSVLGLEC